MKTNAFSARRIAVIGVMAAFCFVSNYLSIPIGTISRIHFGNVFCVLSGLLLGAVPGGFCAGIGAFFYDLTNPLYAASAPITFLMKFALAAVAGLVARVGGANAERFVQNLIAAVAGSLTYVALYLGKSFISDHWVLKNPIETTMVKMATKGASSLTNALIAVVFALILYPIFVRAMKAAHVRE
jgi:uncharacterized membrane protein